jgi:hypothetical protein
MSDCPQIAIIGSDCLSPSFSDRQITRKRLKRSVSRVKMPRSAIRLRGYLRGVFSSGLASWEFNFAPIERKTGLSRRTVERALAWLRENDADFNFQKRRVGRSYSVRVSARQFRPPFPPHPLSPHGVSSGNNRNTASGRIFGKAALLTSPGRRKLAGFAAFLARRDLPDLHWDNCKVRFRFAHAFNFALAALSRGFDRRRIVKAYEAALLQRHRDATDLGLSRGDAASVRFEPSSTVTLALELMRDGLTDSTRRERQLAALAPVKAEHERLRAASRAHFQQQESPTHE